MRERTPAAADALAAVPCGAREALLAAGQLVRFARGGILLRPGEANDALHVVVHGRFDVRLDVSSEPVGSAGPGDMIGEMSVIDGQPASAWVVAATASTVLRVPAERLWSDLLPRPEFARGLLKALTARLRQVLERQLAFEAMRKELRLARDIQTSMLPPPGSLFPERADVDCAAAMVPAADVGGDFYDAFFLDERRLFFAVGDVAGKGIAAALFMARVLTLLRAEALGRRSAPELLGRLNEALAEGNEQATFAALFCGVLDCATGALRFASGGGLAPFLGRGASWRRLPPVRGLVVGAIPGFRYEGGRDRLLPGESLLVFTDGVTEASSPSGEMFGEARLAEVLRGGDDDAALRRVEAVRSAVDAFAADGHRADDLTLLVVRRPPYEAAPATESGR